MLFLVLMVAVAAFLICMHVVEVMVARIVQGWVFFFFPKRLGDFFCPERLSDFFVSQKVWWFWSPS